jgi:hypothetical protein
MKRITSIISTVAKRNTLFALLGALMLFNVLMNAPGLPSSTPSMQAISPSFTPFDLQATGYDATSFTQDLQGLGDAGRTVYRNFMLLDIFFPAIYGLTFASLVWLVFRDRKNWMQWLFLVPLATALTDYLENVFLAIAFGGFPSSSSLAVALASFSTQVKMGFNVLLVLTLLLTLGTWLSRLLRRK